MRSKLIIKTVAYFLSIAAVSCGHASFKNAFATYQSGDYVAAKAAFEAMAAVGSRESLFNLGVMHLKGQATEKDLVESYALIVLAVGEDSDNSAKQAVFNALTADQKILASERILALKSVYGDDAIRAAIVPKPKADREYVQPVRPLSKVAPVYPLTMAKIGKMGMAVAEFTVSPEGYVRDVIVAKTSDAAFSEAAVEAALQARYEKPSEGMPMYGFKNQFTFKYSGGSVDIRAIKARMKGIKSEADKGIAVAQYKYGNELYLNRMFWDLLPKGIVQYKNANDWFLKSAQNGFALAQFELGKNMIEGKGCALDIDGGTRWISAAAIGGLPQAQRHIGTVALGSENMTPDKLQQGIDWLRRAADGNDYYAKVLLAWELSTNVNQSVVNAEAAIELMEAKPLNYFDEVRMLETKAAAYAAAGDFKKAVKLQKKAAKEAKKLNWDIPLIAKRLETYKLGQSYRGSYY